MPVNPYRELQERDDPDFVPVAPVPPVPPIPTAPAAAPNPEHMLGGYDWTPTRHRTPAELQSLQEATRPSTGPVNPYKLLQDQGIANEQTDQPAGMTREQQANMDRIRRAGGDPGVSIGNGPEMSTWDRFRDSMSSMVEHYSPAAWASRQLAPGLGADPNELRQNERDFRENEALRYQADPTFRSGDLWGNIKRGAASIGGTVAGGLISDPTNLIAPGESLGAKVLGQTLIGGGVDAAQQGLEMHEGVRDNFDPLETGVSALGGGAFTGVVEGFGPAAKALRGWWKNRGIKVDHVDDADLVTGSLDGSIDPQSGPMPADDLNALLRGAGASPDQFTNPYAALQAADRIRQARARTPNIGPDELARHEQLQADIEAGDVDPSFAPQPAPRVAPDAALPDVETLRAAAEQNPSDPRAVAQFLDAAGGRSQPNIIAAPEGNIRVDDHGGVAGVERKRAADQAVLDQALRAGENDPVMAHIVASDLPHQTKVALLTERMAKFEREPIKYQEAPDLPPVADVPEVPDVPAWQRSTAEAAGQATSPKTVGAMTKFIMRDLEGGGKRIHDTGGDTRFGVSKKGNPDVDVNNLNEAGADQLYHDRYYKPMKLDGLPPDLQLVAYDAAINHGVGKARSMLAKANGSVDELLRLRQNEYDRLVLSDPGKYASSAAGWKNRLEKLRGQVGGQDPAYRMSAPEGDTIQGQYSGRTQPINEGTTHGGDFENVEARTSPTNEQLEAGTRQEMPTQTGRSDRAFKAVSDDPKDQPGYWEGRAEDMHSEAFKKAQSDLEAEWARREQARKEREHDASSRKEQAAGSNPDPSQRYGAKYGQRPHVDEHGFARTTDDGFVADKDGKPVAFRNSKEAAKFAVKHKLGGDFDRVAWGANSERVGLQRREGSTYGQAPKPEGPAEPAAGRSEDQSQRGLGAPPSAEERAAQSSAGGPENRSEAPAAPEIGPVSREPVVGPAQQVVTPRGRPVDTDYAVYEARDLVTSDHPAFPAELQPRDRAGRSSSDAQVADIAAKLDPEQLHDSRLASQGAPIIGSDRLVESGNGRVSAIRRAYEQHPERAKAYRDMIDRKGLSTEGFEQPVLVRRRSAELPPEDRQKFVREANERDTMSMSSTEQARADAKALPDHVLDEYRGGGITDAGNRGFVRKWMDHVSPAERNNLMQGDGSLSADGARRIRMSMLAKAFDDADLVAKIAEDPDTNIRGVGNAFTDVAPQFAKLRKQVASGELGKEFDISKQLSEFAHMLSKARAEGRPIQSLLSQSDMFNGEVDGVTKAVARLMFKGTQGERWAPRSAQDIAEGLRYYAKEAEKVHPGESLLDDAPAAKPEEILEAAKKRLDAKQGGPSETLLMRGEGGGDEPKVTKPLARELDRIAEHHDNPHVRKLAQHLSDLVGDADVTYGRLAEPDARGRTFRDETGVHAEVGHEHDVEAVLHEAIHVATLQRFGLLSAEKDLPQVVRDLEALRARAEKALRPADADLVRYALSNTDEFLAHGLTSPVFQKWLKAKKTVGMWDRFVDGVRRVLGLEPRYNNLLDQVLTKGSQFVKEMGAGTPARHFEERASLHSKGEYAGFSKAEREGDTSAYDGLKERPPARGAYDVTPEQRQKWWEEDSKVFNDLPPAAREARDAAATKILDDKRAAEKRYVDGLETSKSRKAPEDRGQGQLFMKRDKEGFKGLADLVFDTDGFKGDAAAVKRAIGNPTSALRSFTEPLGRALSAGLFTNDARLRGLGSKFDSKALGELADDFFARPGVGDSTKRTYHEAVGRESITRTQRMFEAIEPHVDNPASMKRIQQLLQFPNKTMRSSVAERDAAKSLRDLLKETIEYRKDAGEDIGEVTDGYYPRMLDVDKVASGREQFLKAAEQLYRNTGASDPKQAARAWFDRVFDEYAGLDGGLDVPGRGTGGVGTKTARPREFGKEADRLLGDFYQDDVFHTLAAYFTGSAKRAEYTRRFGRPGREGSKERKAWIDQHGTDKTKLQELEDRIRDDVRASGKDPAGVLQVVDSVIKSNLGQMGSKDPFTRASVAGLHTWNQLAKMDHTLVTSLGELTMGFVRGGPRYGFGFVKDAGSEFIRQLRNAEPSDAARWAEVTGVVNDAVVNQALTSRIDAQGLGVKSQKVLAGYYKAIGLHQFTNGERIASVKMGRKLMDVWAHDLQSKSPRVRKRAELYMRELGISDPAKFGEQLRGKGFTREDVVADKGMAGEYGTALYRIANQSVMMPSRAEKPTWAAHPVGSLIFSLSGYSYAFKKNVLDRTARLAVQAVKDKDPALLAPAFGLSVMFAMQAVNDTYLRPALFGSKYDFSTETPTEFMLRVSDRAGLTGAMSPFINALKAVKYDRSLAESLSGPVVGSLADASNKFAQVFTDRNSPNTNTAERNAAAALYDVALDPMIDAFAAARLKGMLRSAVVMGTGNKEGGVLPSDRDEFVDDFGGEKPPERDTE